MTWRFSGGRPGGVRCRLTAAVLLLAFFACKATAVGSVAKHQVLFIGNSLTTVNNVPGLVEALSAAAGNRLTCRTVAFDGYSLEDHWNRGDARRAIAEGGWSTIVLQQGPSSLQESPPLRPRKNSTSRNPKNSSKSIWSREMSIPSHSRRNAW